MEELNEGFGETEIGETQDLLARTRRFLHGLDSGSALHEHFQDFAAELEDKLVRLLNLG